MPTSTMRLSVVERAVMRRPVSAPLPPRRPLLLLSLLGCALGATGYLLARLLEPRRGGEEGGADGPAAKVQPSPREPRRTKVSFAADARPGCALHLVAGGQAGLVFTVPPDAAEVSLGRVASNEFVITDTEVSSQHARLAWDGASGAWRLLDVGSLNGTRLNGAPIGRPGRLPGAWQPLSDGDLIHFGERDESPAARVVLTPPPPPPPATPPPAGLPRPPSAPGLWLAHGAAEEAGKGRPSEDRWVAECPLRGHPRAALFCVFDGHCGAAAAEAAAALLPAALAAALSQHPLEGEAGATAAFQAAFAATDAELRQACLYEGCAASALLVWRDPGLAPPRRLFLQAANVGDAAGALAARYAAWVADGGGEPPAPLATHPSQQPVSPSPPPPRLLPPLRPLRLTEDHKVRSSGAERARLAAARGGLPLGAGETRLYGLALSRALGDGFLKDGGEGGGSGLSAEPHVSKLACVHAGEGAFALLASDGLWDVVSPAGALETAVKAAAGGGGWAAAAGALVRAARARHSRDDIAVLLVGLDALAS